MDQAPLGQIIEDSVGTGLVAHPVTFASGGGIVNSVPHWRAGCGPEPARLAVPAPVGQSWR